MLATTHEVRVSIERDADASNGRAPLERVSMLCVVKPFPGGLAWIERVWRFTPPRPRRIRGATVYPRAGRKQMIKATIAIALAAGCAIGSMSISTARAQSFPTRPVTILVPLAAGGSTDTIARIVAEGMRPHLGQPVIVENSPGAGGTTGVIRVARNTPRGRLHRADRAVGHQCRERRGVQPADRSVEGPRAGRSHLDAAFHDRRQEGAAGEQSERAGGVPQSQSRQDFGRHRRHRQSRAMSPACSSRTRWAASLRSSRTAAPGQPRRTCWPATSTS